MFQEPLGLGILLLIAGLVIALLSIKALTPGTVMSTVVWWIGIILAAFGIVLITTPFFVWLDGHVRTIVRS